MVSQLTEGHFTSLSDPASVVKRRIRPRAGTNVPAIGNGCVVPGERGARDPGPNVVGSATLDSRFRGNNGTKAGYIVPGERS